MYLPGRLYFIVPTTDSHQTEPNGSNSGAKLLYQTRIPVLRFLNFALSVPQERPLTRHTSCYETRRVLMQSRLAAHSCAGEAGRPGAAEQGGVERLLLCACSLELMSEMEVVVPA
jgi:hypothetical protein